MIQEAYARCVAVIRLAVITGKRRVAMKLTKSRIEHLLQRHMSEHPGPASRPDALIAAVQIVATSLGVEADVSSDDLIQAARPAQRLRDVCERYGLYVRKVTLTGSWWKNGHLPLIAFITATDHTRESSRPVALIASRGARYTMVDPMQHERCTINEATATTIDRHAFALYAQSSNGLSALSILRSTVNRNHRPLLLACALAVLGGALNTLVPVVTGIIYGSVIPASDPAQLYKLTAVLFGSAVGVCGFQIIRTVTVVRFMALIELHLEPLIWGRLLSLPLSFFGTHTVGDLASRLRGAGTIRRVALTDVLSAALSLLTSFGPFVLLFVYSVRVASALTLVLLCAVTITVVLSSRTLKYQRDSLACQGRLSTLVFAIVSAMPKLRSSCSENRAYALWSQGSVKRARLDALKGRLTTGQASFTGFYVVMSDVVLLAIAGLYLRDAMSLSAFTSFAAAFAQVQAALLIVMNVIPVVFQCWPLSERIYPIVSAAQEQSSTGKKIALQGNISLLNVCFAYQEHSRPALCDVSLRVAAGECVALLGPSGSGKSTMVKLLLGFEKPDGGSILYDGIDMSLLDVGNLRRQCGVVLQNSKPIAGDIISNIVGGGAYDMDAAWDAARLAGLDKVIKAMPMKMYTIINEGGATLSGGERQRLMLARALYNKPKILLLDEATSSLDGPSEELVQTSLRDLYVTRVIIAHRLATVRHAQRIYVMDQGRLIDEGTYSDLARGSRYLGRILGLYANTSAIQAAESVQ